MNQLQKSNQTTPEEVDDQSQTDGIETSLRNSSAIVESKNNADINFEICSFNRMTTNNFSDYEPIINHITNIIPFICNVCGKSFKYKSQYILHQRTHTKEKPYVCSVCKMKFVAQSQLNKHIAVHSDDKPFTCDICNYSCKRKSALYNHVQIHGDEKKFKCNVCNQTFRFRNTLKRHEVIHSDLRPHVCDICGTGFKLRDHLKGHMTALHSTEKKYYSCKLCNEAFEHRDVWVHHMQEHTSEKPLVCEICQERFSARINLKSHIIKHYTKGHTCTKCNENYNIKYIFKHMKICTGPKTNGILTGRRINEGNIDEIYNVQIPDSDTVRTTRDNYLSTKIYMCRICKKGFNFLSSLRKHVKVHERQG